MLYEHKKGNVFDIFVTDSGKFKSKYVIKLIDGNLGLSENKIVLPHFMAMFL